MGRHRKPEPSHRPADHLVAILCWIVWSWLFNHRPVRFPQHEGWQPDELKGYLHSDAEWRAALIDMSRRTRTPLERYWEEEKRKAHAS